MAFGFAERRDIERVVRSVLVTERINNSERPRPGVGQSAAPPCAYIAQSSTSGIAASTGGSTPSGTVKFFQVSTGGTLTEISTGETVYNFSNEAIQASKYFLAVREYGSQNYVSVPGSGGQFGRIKGTLVGAMATGDSTKNIDNIIVLSGADPRTDSTSTTETVTVNNSDHTMAGDDNAVARAEWNPVDERWEFYQVTCPA